MSEKILFVDDDKEILNSFKRLLRKRFIIDTALEAKAGLEAIRTRGPYAVIVSDMRMPGMDGVQFLSKVKEITPDSVRIMLTGNADMDTAVDAVNQGNIFRFLSKPCPPELFATTLLAALEQYRLITAERILLEKTLSHSIKVLIDILSMVNSVAFSRAARIRRYIKHMSAKLNLENAWQYELAGMLSQIGCVTLPQEVIEKYYAEEELTEDERQMFNTHPSVGKELLERIPRMEAIALMIESQEKPFGEYEEKQPPDRRSEVDIGAQMLKAALEFDKFLSAGQTQEKIIQLLKQKPDICDPALISALLDIDSGRTRILVSVIKVKDINVGMTLTENIYTKRGMLVAPKGQEITYPLKERIKNFFLNKLIGDEVRVILKKHDFSDIR